MNASNERNKESVWEYPRPPRVEECSKSIRVVFNNTVVAETNRAVCILETSHPPTYYIPRDDVQEHFLSQSNHQSYCEFKGLATYYNLGVGERASFNAAWSYNDPYHDYKSIKNHVAFYPGRVDACYVGDERVRAQEGDFYGGWITSDLVGPFKGGSGTAYW